MKSTSIYLYFTGQCEEAFNFYKRAIGGEITVMSRFKEMPTGPDQPVLPEIYADQIMHVTLTLGDDINIMGSDQPEGFGPPHLIGTNFSISLGTESREETDKVFQALSEEGTVTMPLADTFWGSYFGMCTDRYGVNWMVSFDTQSTEQ